VFPRSSAARTAPRGQDPDPAVRSVARRAVRSLGLDDWRPTAHRGDSGAIRQANVTG
jgi:hypothetical protein